jgi:hypothetical protein
MATWSEFESAAPELAARVRERFDAHKHKTMATVRRDGSPRISGTETEFKEGELWIGSMWKAVKALDLRRDPRFAIHSATFDPDKDWPGEAKVAGVAEEVIKEHNGGGDPSHLFRLDVREVSTVGLNAERTKLLIEVWTPERGVRVIER